jgi:hypothetical protein
MIKPWQEYSAGRFPKDPLLEEGRSRFFETLLINPIDYSALNGLGNILLFQGELDAAEFFVSSAIKCAKKDGADYWQAKHDLELIRSRLAALLFCRSDLSIRYGKITSRQMPMVVAKPYQRQLSSIWLLVRLVRGRNFQSNLEGEL